MLLCVLLVSAYRCIQLERILRCALVLYCFLFALINSRVFFPTHIRSFVLAANEFRLQVPGNNLISSKHI